MGFLIIFLSLGLPASIVLIVFISIGYKKSGVLFWTQYYMLFKGVKSTAIIIDSADKATSLSINKSLQYMFTVVMDVIDPNTGTKYMLKRKYMDSWYSILKNKNAEIPVIVHPTDNETVMIDFKTIRKNKKEAMKRIDESDENRLNQLMNN
jgi:hypothetical protein